MTPVITPQALAELTAFQGHPCLSLYQRTHRHHPDNQQDPLRFRQLVKALETSLRQQHADDAVRSLLAPFEALADDTHTVLAALPEHHHLFRQISHNPFLMADGLTVNPEALDADTLRERAWQAAEPAYEARMAAWFDAYGAAAAAGLGSGDLATVARAVVAGRVDTLLIEADRELPGRIDPTTGRIDEADLDNRRADDVLDDLGAWVERMGGVVHVLDTARMPGSTGLAATFRHA